MFELLAEPIRKYIRDKRWEFLRPIQAAAIQKVLTTEDNLILASRTASGKTEAAFLPVLSKVDFNQPSVQVLYISPLIALINDQFNRVEELCDYLDVPVTKWHGEAKRSLKDQLIKHPRGVVLITPESLEAMLDNGPQNASLLFSGLRYIIIDEIHSFIGSDRGIHLKSILSRIQYLNKDKFLVIGLSATIGDYDEAKKMTGDEANTKVLLDKTSKPMDVEVRYFEQEGNDLPINLMKDLYLSVKDHKVLIFPNSRGRAEEIAVKLKKISDKVSGHTYYFSHHSSIDRELREYIEHFAKNNIRYPFAIACTSTLELGIDIGSVDLVIQIDSAHSIASLIQRLGRSGRRDGELSKLLCYATDKWSLLQSLACLALYKEGFVEPVAATDKPYDILLHQILAYVKQLSGCTRVTLLQRVTSNYAFTEIAEDEVQEIIDELLKNDLLESIGGELIIGVEGEWIVNHRDFYSVFITPVNYKVMNYDRTIGEIPLSPQLQVDQNILLAARIWKIIDIDDKAKKISVIPANDGKKPMFFGSGGDIHPKVRERMLQLLYETDTPAPLDEAATDILKEIREEFNNYPIESLTDDRPVVIKDNTLKLYTFQGTKVNKTMEYLINLAGLEMQGNEHESSFTFSGSLSDLREKLLLVPNVLNDLDLHIENTVRATPDLLSFSKWGEHLPVKYQCRLLKNKYFDFEATELFIQALNPIKHAGRI